MSLSSETQAQLLALLDKPISPSSIQQIVSLLNRRTLPSQSLANTFISKHRGDLLIFLMQNWSISLATLQGILESVRKDILRYSQRDVEAIWSLALRKEQFAGRRQEWGLESVVREGLRRPNEEAKQRLLWLASSNFQIMKELKEGKVIKSFVQAYLQQYLKYTLYLAPFSAIARQCLHVATQSQAQLLDQSRLAALLKQTLALLDSTVNRLLYSFHNQCLLLLEELLKVKDLHVDTLQAYTCGKVIGKFLYRKGTRQRARACKQALSGREEQHSLKEKDKMNYNIAHESQTQETPLLIQNVIEKVNEYRHRQQLVCLQLLSSQSSGKKRSISSNRKNHSRSKVDEKLQSLVERCFQQRENTKMYGIHELHEGNQLQAYNCKEQLGGKTISQISVCSSRAQEFEEFAQISSLIDLAYQYKFG